MRTEARITSPRKTARPFAGPRTRGAVSVMAMIMLVLFGSLVAAMAIASKGNLRTSATHLTVLRANGAAETGLDYALDRLDLAAGRFMISSSVVDAQFGEDFWTGNLSGYGSVTVLPPPTGHAEGGDPAGLAEALFNMHAADANVVTGINMPTLEIRNAPATADPAVYSGSNWLVTAPVAISGVGNDARDAFQITYAPLANGTDVRIIVTGYDFGYDSTRIQRDFDGAAVVDGDGDTQNQRFLTRVVTQDVRITKSVNNAIISPSKIMIGKNVRVTGNIGASFTGTSFTNGDPVVMTDDFEGLDSGLDTELTTFADALALYDVDGDNRLLVGHPVERQGVPLTECYPLVGGPSCPIAGEGDAAKRARSDVTGDGYYDAFDVVIRHFDTPTSGASLNEYDNRIEIETEFVNGFGDVIDQDLADLIDSANPDRNVNGLYGFFDDDGDGRFNELAGETLVDIQVTYDEFGNANGTYYPDRELGYLDGYLDFMDQYAKLDGSLQMRVAQSDWATYNDAVNGSLVPDQDDAAVNFGVGNDVVPTLSAASFAAAANNLTAAANGIAFWDQVADQLGIGVASIGTYVEAKPEVSYDPMDPSKPAARYIRVDADTDFDGLPDNYNDPNIHFEKMPFNSPNFSDWYYRPVFQNMVFKDVEIPQGVNGLFENCTFIGVTWIRSEVTNTHAFWNQYGKMEIKSGNSYPTQVFEREVYGDEAGEDMSDVYQPVLDNMNPPGQMLIKTIEQTLDKADLLQSEVNATNQADFDALPEPIIIDGVRVIDTKDYSNNIRFHDCLIVGSIVSDPVTDFTHVRNKVQFTGVTRFTQVNPDDPTDPAVNPDSADTDLIARSSLMLPNYSVDIGQFNSPAGQSVSLQGAIITGVLDVRGNADINGALLMTFEPILGSGPLQDYLGQAVGNPANFNTTLGYFGPDDGDEESLNPQDLPVDASGNRIVGWDVDGDGIADVPGTEAQPSGSTAVLFEGYGKIDLRYDPDMILPDGILVPMSTRTIPSTYAEGTI